MAVTTPAARATRRGGALPTMMVIGAMKCGTSAAHRYLDRHPEVAMSTPKELNFFFGDRRGDGDDYRPEGNWGKELAWYARHFPADPHAEASPRLATPRPIIHTSRGG